MGRGVAKRKIGKEVGKRKDNRQRRSVEIRKDNTDSILQKYLEINTEWKDKTDPIDKS